MSGGRRERSPVRALLSCLISWSCHFSLGRVSPFSLRNSFVSAQSELFSFPEHNTCLPGFGIYGLWVFTKLLFLPSMGTRHWSSIVGFTHQVSGRVGIFKSAPTSMFHTLLRKSNKGSSPGMFAEESCFCGIPASALSWDLGSKGEAKDCYCEQSCELTS